MFGSDTVLWIWIKDDLPKQFNWINNNRCVLLNTQGSMKMVLHSTRKWKKPRELSMEYLNFNWSSTKTQSQMASATFRAKLLRQSLVNSLTIWLANKKMKKKKYYSIVEIPQMRLLLNAIFAESLMSHFSYFYVVCVLKLGIKLTKHPRNAISEAPPTSPFLALQFISRILCLFLLCFLFLYSCIQLKFLGSQTCDGSNQRKRESTKRWHWM